MNRERIAPAVSLLLVTILIFGFFFLFFYSIYTLAPGKAFPDDVFYHMAHSISYRQGWDFTFPVYSTYSTHPADLYIGYHFLMGLFIGNGEGSLGGVFSRIGTMNAFFNGLYFSIFFLVSYAFARDVLKLSLQSALWSGIFAVLLLAGVGGMFLFRMLLIRPHIFSSLFLVLSFYYAIKKNYRVLFFLGLLLPFFYSVSFFVLLPPLAVLGAEICLRGFKIRDLNTYLPFMSALLGLTVGIIARPDSINYLYNSYFAHLMSVFTALTHITREGKELSASPFTFVDFAWLLSMMVLFALYVGRYHLFRSVKKTISLPLLSLGGLTTLFMFLFLFINRAGEYFFPFWALLIASAFAIVCSQPVHEWVRGREHDDGSFAFLLGRSTEQLWSSVQKHKNSFITFLVGVLVLFTLTSWGHLAWSMQVQERGDLYKRAAEFIEKDSGGEGTVFTQAFSFFPMLVFHNHANRYIMGMGSIFTYLYDKTLYWKYEHIVAGEKICPKRQCVTKDDGEDMYTVIRDDFHARYIFVDEYPLVGTERVLKTPSFIKLLKADGRFKQAFVDGEHPSVKVYKLL